MTSVILQEVILCQIQRTVSRAHRRLSKQGANSRAERLVSQGVALAWNRERTAGEVREALVSVVPGTGPEVIHGPYSLLLDFSDLEDESQDVREATKGKRPF